MYSRLPILKIFRACCFSALIPLAFLQEAFAQAPGLVAPTEFQMVTATFRDSGTPVWRLKWRDNSTVEEGFEIRYRINSAWPGPGLNVIVPYKMVPTALSLTGVTTTGGSKTVTCASTEHLSAGWSITGSANIPSDAVVESVTSPTTFVLSTASTGSGTVTGQTLLAASIYQAASNYIYVMDMDVPSSKFGGYEVEWFVYTYQGTSIAGPADLTRRMLYAQSAFLPPNALTVTTPTVGEFHVAYYDKSWLESHFELDYKLHSDTAWSTLRVDFSFEYDSVNAFITLDLTGDETQTNMNQTATTSGKLYLPNYISNRSYDFRIRAVDFDGNKTPYSATVSATSLP